MERQRLGLALLLAIAVLFSGVRVLAASPQAPVVDDHTIVSDIEHKLFLDSALKQRDIRVQCNEGVVTLSGTVNTRLEKSAAERIASQELGVKHVVSQLKIAGATPATAPPPPPKKPVVPQTSAAQNQRMVTVPAGTRILIRTVDSIDSSKQKAGFRFTATLETNLQAQGMVVAPGGTTVYGRLAQASSAGNMSGGAQLTLELTDIVINGNAQPLLTSMYEIKSQGQGSKTAKRVVGGTGLGALIGGIAGGGKGAAIGAGAGAVTGTVVSGATKGQQLVIPSESLIEFRLQQPASLTVR